MRQNNNKNNQNCYICGWNDSALIFTENGCPVFRCGKCEFVYVYLQPNTLEMSKTEYPVEDYKKYCENYIFNKEKYNLRSKKLINIIEEYKYRKGKILEIGCAAGFFLNVANNNGWNSFGIEPDKFLFKYAKNVFGLNVANVSLEKAKYKDNTFDVIVALNVLSHIKDPFQFFYKVKRMLKPNGLLVLETGNKGACSIQIKAEILGENWLIPEHLFHFSEKSLSVLFDRTGFFIKGLIKKHVVEHLFSEEYLITKTNSKLRRIVKRLLLEFSVIRKISVMILKFYYIRIKKADLCSLLYFLEIKKEHT